MKRLVMLLAAVSLTGCTSLGDTPAYTAKERGQQIARNWDFERRQINDDIDHVLLLRPMGHLTIWHLR